MAEKSQRDAKARRVAEDLRCKAGSLSSFLWDSRIFPPMSLKQYFPQSRLWGDFCGKDRGRGETEEDLGASEWVKS